MKIIIIIIIIELKPVGLIACWGHTTRGACRGRGIHHCLHGPSSTSLSRWGVSERMMDSDLCSFKNAENARELVVPYRKVLLVQLIVHY